MRISVIIPVYNEKNTISVVVNKLYQMDLVAEIVVFDDGSTDGTSQILRQLNNSLNSKMKIIFKKNNQGKGVAIREALESVSRDIVVVQDADLEYNPEEIKELIKPIEDKAAEVVFGSRFDNPLNPPPLYRRALWGNFILTKLINLLFGSDFKDAYVCYKALPLNLLKEMSLKSRGFEIEAELACKVAQRKLRVSQVPISYKPRSWQEGKKIGFYDGIKGIFYILKFWLTRD